MTPANYPVLWITMLGHTLGDVLILNFAAVVLRVQTNEHREWSMEATAARQSMCFVQIYSNIFQQLPTYSRYLACMAEDWSGKSWPMACPPVQKNKTGAFSLRNKSSFEFIISISKSSNHAVVSFATTTQPIKTAVTTRVQVNLKWAKRNTTTPSTTAHS